jgi:hypothetical protein
LTFKLIVKEDKPTSRKMGPKQTSLPLSTRDKGKGKAPEYEAPPDQAGTASGTQAIEDEEPMEWIPLYQSKRPRERDEGDDEDTRGNKKARGTIED